MHVEVDAFRSQVEVSQAKLQRLERSNAHLRKQRAQMMADLQASMLSAHFTAGVRSCFKSVSCWAGLYMAQG